MSRTANFATVINRIVVFGVSGSACKAAKPILFVQKSLFQCVEGAVEDCLIVCACNYRETLIKLYHDVSNHSLTQPLLYILGIKKYGTIYGSVHFSIY